MSEGELLQIQKSRSLDIEEETYYRIVSDKTASLLSTCCESGAFSSGASPEAIRAMKEYGENTGVAFQIRDDVLDYVGRKSITGKPTGLDIKEKKISLPLIHALRQASKKESRSLLRVIKHGATSHDVQRVVRFVEEYGGIDYATKKACEFGETAKNSIAFLPESESKNSLLSFVDFVIQRSK
jgi:octaprenyl-diphosphate synthase